MMTTDRLVGLTGDIAQEYKAHLAARQEPPTPTQSRLLLAEALVVALGNEEHDEEAT